MNELIGLLLGLTITVGFGPVWIPFFKRLKFGQYIREDGPQAHLAKSGTPTFGGLMFMSSVLLGAIVMFQSVLTIETTFVIVSMFGFGLIGFSDDFIKVVKKNNLGLRAWQKIVGMLTVSVLLFLAFMTSTISVIPFLNLTISSGLLFFVFFTFVAIAITNAVNLTDGIDGLCASVTLTIAIFFTVVAVMSNHTSLAILNMLMAGSLLGYLVYNWNPAKVFMGDTGSLALGGYVLANAFILNIEWFIPVFGIIYVLETLSVIIQVGYYKKTKKRFFKMAPLHHHFELVGWSEYKLVWVSVSVTALACLVTWVCVII